MADSKISALPASTTPLAGTETLPIVQSGVTKKVAVDDLTAGRSPSMNYAILNNGLSIKTSGVNRWLIQKDGSDDLYVYRYDNAGAYAGNPMTISRSNGQVRFENGAYQGTAGTGFNFTANSAAAGMTSQLLNWYEEGTFTPVVAGSTTAGTATYSLQNGRYTRIGRQVYIEVALSWSGGTGTGNFYVTGLPFTSANGGTVSGMTIALADFVATTANNVLTAFVPSNTSRVELWQYPTGGGAANNVGYDALAALYFSGSYTV